MGEGKRGKVDWRRKEGRGMGDWRWGEKLSSWIRRVGLGCLWTLILDGAVDGCEFRKA